MEKIKITPRKIAVIQKISKDVFSSMKFEKGIDGDDFIRNQMTARLEATVLSSQCQIQKVYHYAEAPSFWDWFHSRRKKIVIEIEVNDLMLNPPKIDSARTFEIKIQNP